MWKTVELSSVATVTAGQSPKGKHYNKEGRGTPFYQGKKDYGERYLKEPTVWTEVVTKLAEKDDILMSVRAPVGSLNIATQQICIGRGLAAIRPSTEILHDFLFYSLLLISQQLKGNVGIGFNSINKAQIEAIKIPLPPLAEQKRIVAKLDAAFAEIDEAISGAEAKEIEVQKLYRFLLENLFKENYAIKKIGDLGDVKSGGTPKSTEQSYWNGDINWYSSGELNSMYSSQTAKHVTNIGLSNSNAKIFPKGSLLIGMYDTAAMKMSILKKEASFNQAIVGIPPNQFVLPEYLFYVLNFLKPKILLQRRGVRQQNLSLAKIKNIEIPIPSIKQQQYIVSKANRAAQKIESILKTLSRKKAQLAILKSAILSQELQPSEAA